MQLLIQLTFQKTNNIKIKNNRDLFVTAQMELPDIMTELAILRGKTSKLKIVSLLGLNNCRKIAKTKINQKSYIDLHQKHL